MADLLGLPDVQALTDLAATGGARRRRLRARLRRSRCALLAGRCPGALFRASRFNTTRARHGAGRDRFDGVPGARRLRVDERAVAGAARLASIVDGGPSRNHFLMQCVAERPRPCFDPARRARSLRARRRLSRRPLPWRVARSRQHRCASPCRHHGDARSRRLVSTAGRLVWQTRSPLDTSWSITYAVNKNSLLEMKMGRINELRLIARVAQMYHGEGKRQAEIADHLHMSQATDLAHAEAGRAGRHRPHDSHPSAWHVRRPRSGAARALRPRRGDRRRLHRGPGRRDHGAHRRGAPRIFSRSPSSRTRSSASRAGARPILRMVDNIHPLKGTKAKYVVQTLGGMGDPSVQTHATQLTTRLARLTGGEPRLLPVQGVATSREAKLVMLADPFVRETMDLFGSISLAIIGIGAVEPSELLGPLGQRLLAPGTRHAERCRRGRRHLAAVLRPARAAGEDPARRTGDRHLARGSRRHSAGHGAGRRRLEDARHHGRAAHRRDRRARHRQVHRGPPAG